MRTGPVSAPGRLPAQLHVLRPAPAKSSVGTESAHDPKSGRRDDRASGEAVAPRHAQVTKIERGPNSVLIYNRPRELRRRVLGGKIFAGEFLRVHPGERQGPLTPSMHSLSAVEASYDAAVVQRFIASDAEAIRLPLDARRTVVVNVERLLSRGPVTHTMIGKVDGDSFSDVLLVFHDGAVSGSVAFYDENAHYEFGLAGNGDIAIRRLDPESFTASCGDPGGPPQADAGHDDGHDHLEDAEPPGTPEAPDHPQSDPPAEDPEAATVVMDTVVGYGSAARSAEGGVAAMEARIIASVDRMNTAFANSRIAGVEVVLMGTVEDPNYVFPGAVSGEMGSSDELGDLKNTRDGVLDTVSDLRIALGADHNAFIVKQVDGSAGIASRPGNSMIVARTYMSSYRITFAHEFGHSIGCQHAWGDTSSATSTSSHNFGWRLDPPSSGRVRTIMSYDWGWTRIPYFSNPSVQYNGANTGAVDGYNATGDATADPRCVSGGLTGSAGSGYNGSHSRLGARNADYIMNRAQYLADNATRTVPEIVIEQPLGSGLLDGASTVDFNASAEGAGLSRTFVIRNTGDADLTGLSVTKDGRDAADFTIGSLGATSLVPGGSTTFTVTYQPPAAGLRTAALHIASNDGDENPFDVILTGAVRSLIAEEDFEAGFGEWTDSAGSGFDFNWARESGGTPSSSTGPVGASEGSWYVYADASAPNHPGKTAGLEKQFDFRGRADLLMTFDYHMYGSDMGILSVDVFDGAWHLGVWSRSGAQQASGSDSWAAASVDLSAWDNAEELIIRVRGETGDDYRSDMAVDGISILGVTSGSTLAYAAGAGGTLSGPTSQIVSMGADGDPVTAVPNSDYHFVDWSDGLVENPRIDTNVTADIMVTANFAPGLRYADWAMVHGLTGDDALPEAVPFREGVSNLLKYAFNMNGSGPDVRSLVPATGSSGLPVLCIDASGAVPVAHFEYLRRKIEGVTYLPVQSSTGVAGDWGPMSGAVTVTEIDLDWERVVIEHPLGAAFPVEFFRVEITLP